MTIQEKFENLLLLKNFSKNSISSYCGILKNIMHEDADLFEKDKDYIISFLAKKIRKGKFSASYVAQYVSVINIVLRDILLKSESIKIPRPNKPVKQPDILSTQEVQRMIETISNVKHKAILLLMYSTGLRVSEVCALKLKDINSDNKFISIKNAKGMKDRVVMLDDLLLYVLRDYYREYKPNVYLFNGQKGDMYSCKSIQNIVKKAALDAGIDKDISSHSMRHSCFTQLLKNGTDIRYIQRLAGHKNISTTARYLQISDNDVLSIKSPLDLLNINSK